MARREVLPNGTTLLVEATHVAPIVALVQWVPWGAADEPAELSGVSHFLEHMLLKDEGDDASLARVTQEAGGYLNARTGYDHTAFYQVVPTSGWRAVMEAAHRTLAAAAFSEGHVATERRVVSEEAKIAERDPSAFLWRRLMEKAFSGGYGRPIVGTESSIAGIDAPALSARFAQCYSRKDMIQVVAGDVDADEVVDAAVDLAERGASGDPATGHGHDADPDPWATPGAGGERGARGAPRQRPAWHPGRVVSTGVLQQPYVAVAFEAPPVTHDDMPALDALCGILGLGRSSRLLKSLRTSLGLVSDVASGVAGYRDTGVLAVRAVGTDGAEPERIVEEVFRQIRRLKDAPPDGSEALKSLRRIEAGYALEHETVETVAMTLGFFEAMGDYHYADGYLDRLAEVTPEDLVRVARDCLDAEEAAVGVLAPEPSKLDAAALSSAVRRGDASTGAVSKGAAPLRESSGVWMASTLTRPSIVRESAQASFSRTELAGAATLVLRRTPGVPLVSIALGFRGGFTDEPDQRLGVTSLMLKHMLRGTRTRSASQLADDVEGLGSGMSVSVDRDGFGVGLTVLASYLDEALKVLGEAVCSPALQSETFDPVRAEALAELGEAEDHPLRRTMRRLRPLLFPGHPYGRATGGTRESLASLTPDEIRSWHRERVVADRLFVCMTGDVEAGRAAEAVGTALSGLPVTGPPEIALGVPGIPLGRVEEDLERKGQSSVAVGFSGPRIGTVEAAAMHVAASSLTMMGGRLWRALRERPPHAYSVRLTPVPMRLGGALIGHVTTPPGQEEAAVATFVTELDAVARDGLRADELERGRRYLAGLIDISMQRGAARAASYAVAEVAGTGFERVERLSEIVRGVTRDDIVRAARRYVSAEDAPAVAVLRA